jgi:hypothetical protein
MGPAEEPRAGQTVDLPRTRTLTTWEVVFGLLSLTSLVITPFSCCLALVFLGASLALAWLAALPRVLRAPRGGPAGETLRVVYGALGPIAAGLAMVANAPLERDALPWLVVHPKTAAAGCVIPSCLAAVAFVRRLASSPSTEEEVP